MFKSKLTVCMKSSYEDMCTGHIYSIIIVIICYLFVHSALQLDFIDEQRLYPVPHNKYLQIYLYSLCLKFWQINCNGTSIFILIGCYNFVICVMEQVFIISDSVS
jgi:hypothetical protein